MSHISPGFGRWFLSELITRVDRLTYQNENLGQWMTKVNDELGKLCDECLPAGLSRPCIRLNQDFSRRFEYQLYDPGRGEPIRSVDDFEAFLRR